MEPKNPVIWTSRYKVMAKCISIYFDIFYEKLVSSGFLPARPKTKKIINDMIVVALILPDSSLRNPLKKMFLSENVIFWGLRLSLVHFGRQAPESHVSQLQNGVSTSSLPLFIVDSLTFKDYSRSNSFVSMGILEGVKWQTSRAAYNGPKQR